MMRSPNLSPTHLQVLIAAIILFLGASTALAQADLQLNRGPGSLTSLSSTRVYMGVTNRGDARSDSFRLKIVLSADENIDEDDLFSISGVLGPVEPDGAISHFIDYRLPLPEPDNRTQPRLTDDSRSPIEWVGETIFAQSCLMSAVEDAVIACSEIRTIVVGPPAMGDVTLTNGLSREVITASIPLPPEDTGQPLADSFEMTESYYQMGGTKVTNTLVLGSGDLTAIDGEKYFVRNLTGRQPGTMYEYTERLRTCLEVPLKGRVCTPLYSRSAPNYVGNALGDAVASNGLTGRIDVSWNPFSDLRLGSYVVIRCENDQPETCTEIAREVTATSFSDTTAERGKRYRYQIDACDPRYAIPACSISFRPPYKMSVSNVATIGLPDRFEDDDQPEQAAEWRSSFRQLRSFDTPDDNDWLKIVLEKPQSLVVVSGGETANDTELSLYDDSLSLLFYNDNPQDRATLYASIRVAMLPKGVYYLKVNQKFSSLPPLFKPVPNYTLTLDLGRQINLIPVFNLLFDN